MSGAASTATRERSIARIATPRSLALLGIAVLTAGYCSTLYWVTTIAGGTAWLAGAVAVGVGTGVLLRNTPERRVARIAAVGAVLAAGWYYTSAVTNVDVGAVARVTRDSLAMLTGITVLELTAVDVWIAALVPIPIFLSTYFALRRRYELAVAAGGWIVVFLALTGDATVLETLVGAIGVVTAVGFGELDRRGGSIGSADVLVAAVALMAVLAVAVPLTPSGSVDALEPRGVDAPSVAGDSSPATATPLDEQLLSGDDVAAGGPINLSTDVRFVVESPTRHRWRLAALDSYTGDSWTRAGNDRAYMNALLGPPGDNRVVVQRYDLRAEAADLPAAATPVDVRNLSRENLLVTSTGTLSVDGRLPSGTEFTVESQVPTPTETELRTAGRNYPAAIERRYTRLGEETVPDRVYNLTDQVTSQASSPFGTAQAVESYLENTKKYSQNVSAPEGNLADSFLFEMDAGYCTYYAGTMATMLRTQGIPARVAVGYSSGQWVGNDTWVVRGTDAHAWVEVYFPQIGWIEFDPTPASDVRDARRDAVESARSNATGGVDVLESEDRDLRYEQPSEPTRNDTDDPAGTNETATNDTDGGSNTSAQTFQGTYSGLGYSPVGNGTSVPYVEPDLNVGPVNGSEEDESATNATGTLRSGDRLLGGFDAAVLALLIVVGSVAGGRQAGVQRRLRHAGGVLWQRRRDPETDLERAIERLDSVLEARYGSRRPGETRRAYRRRLPDVAGPRVYRALELCERARYAGETDPETVDELVGIVDDLARERLPGIRRFK